MEYATRISHPIWILDSAKYAEIFYFVSHAQAKLKGNVDIADLTGQNLSQ